ncbi:MAG: NAD-dependent epimerase/dehydratase family protein, partial [candidate division Zixibacteria bacterium]|nr:NAD-dependent epimerase/dehydratase family protein [candidate division Zixibacteria bacterium]
MRYQRILITGASGSLGKQLIYEFMRRDIKPIAQVRKNSNTTYIDSFSLEKRIADLRDEQKLNQLVAGIDAVIHTAAWVNFRQDQFSQFAAINTSGAVKLFEAARKGGVKRFVHVSTIAAVGAIPSVTDQKDRLQDHTGVVNE